MTRSKIKLVCGIGINDANYVIGTIKIEESDNKLQKLRWSCPYYARWRRMLARCYNDKCQYNQPTYKDCYVTEEWHRFMTFRAWMEKQDWEGKHLDKDILFPGNREYSPDKCVFVDGRVNTFLIESDSARGEWPIGVTLHKPSGKFRAFCRSVITGNKKSLGYHSSPEEAYQAWLAFKLEQAKILAAEQNDHRVAEALIKRYQNYV